MKKVLAIVYWLVIIPPSVLIVFSQAMFVNINPPLFILASIISLPVIYFTKEILKDEMEGLAGMPSAIYTVVWVVAWFRLLQFYWDLGFFEPLLLLIFV